MIDIKPKMVDGEPMCSDDCPQFKYSKKNTNIIWCLLQKPSPTYIGRRCFHGVIQQRDEYRDKMNEARREICSFVVMTSRRLSSRNVAKERGWDCFEGEE